MAAARRSARARVCSLPHAFGDALVDIDRGAVDVGARVRHEEYDKAANVRGLSEAVDPQLARQFGARLGSVEVTLAGQGIDALSEAVGLDVAGMNGVHAHAVAAANVGERLGDM